MLFRVIFLVLFIQFFLSACSSNTETASINAKNELIVLSHGLGRSDTAMWRLASKFEDAGYQVCAIDYDTLGKSVEQVFKQSREQINRCLDNNGIFVKTHFVGHSLGGLVIRDYLTRTQQQANLKLGEVVLVGTPNKGSEVADHMKGNTLMESFGGGISQSLVTGEKTLGSTLPEFDFAVGVIAGTKSSSLTNHLFPAANDGLVSVESAKVNNMKDFIALNVSHSAMRYDAEVAEQIIHFLETGHFKNIPVEQAITST